MYYRFIVIDDYNKSIGGIFRGLGPVIRALYEENDQEPYEIANGLNLALSELEDDLEYPEGLLNDTKFAFTDEFITSHRDSFNDLQYWASQLGWTIKRKEVELTINDEILYKDANQIAYRRKLTNTVADMQEMINEAKARKVRPQDLFEFDNVATLVNATAFFGAIIYGKQDSYKQQARDRILMNGRNDEFYKVLVAYLDSLGTKRLDYKKLEPALCSKKDGKLFPEDGRNRAQLCMLLGIELPVRIIPKK